ncbi:hypothetical protein QQ045_010904 [Rhodiola kirilowii]
MVWATDAAMRITNLANQFYFYNSSLNINAANMLFSDFEWRKPPRGYLKINCDAAWDGQSKKGAIAAIARDSEGIVHGVRALSLEHCNSSEDCEGLSISEALKLGANIGNDKVIIESDCSKVVHDLNVKADTVTRWGKLVVRVASGFKIKAEGDDIDATRFSEEFLGLKNPVIPQSKQLVGDLVDGGLPLALLKEERFDKTHVDRLSCIERRVEVESDPLPLGSPCYLRWFGET